MSKAALSPGKKAQLTAKWARTMTKWQVTYNRRRGAKWTVVDFGGKSKAESAGIVDLMAIRKDHSRPKKGLKRGDLFEIVLIQVKGGSGRLPTLEDIARLHAVARYHRARTVVLVVWKRKRQFDMFELERSNWRPVAPAEIFG